MSASQYDICMSQITRRSLIRNSGIAASVAALSAVSLPGVAATEDAAGTVFHVFAFQWKPGTTEAQKEKAAREIAAFQGQIPGLLQTHVGPNISPRGKGYMFGGIMQFKDKASLDAYVQHPSHQALLAWLVPLIDAIELDLRA
jgi:Stress responsive A/B Barrel Domain